ncbi:heparinase II/III family protein [Bacillus sp. FSL K6-6540]|uniref:heparinase II/III family protein n=1 Tax=Bacillus sp. FSL K6-6540 TaxID=2921512 RepID=UPI0030F65048
MNRMQELTTIANGMAPADLRMYYLGGDQRSFWEGIQRSGDYEQDISEIREEGERLLSVPNPALTYDLFTRFARQGTRLDYEKVYFERRRRLNTFALLTLLEPDKEAYRIALQEMIWSICDEYTWCLPAHLNAESPGGIKGTIDLFSAETGFTLSEIRVLLRDRLPSLLISRIGEEVEARLFLPFLSREHGWETATHNWSAVCAGSIGSAALLLMESGESLAKVLLKTERCMDYYLQGFGSDGACLEGLGYWNYGFGYFVYYADLLRKRTRGEMDWFRSEKVGRIALFQQQGFLGGKAVVNFSDSQPESTVHIGLSHYLAGLYGDFESPPQSLRSGYRDDHCSRWAPALRNLIWRNPLLAGSDWEEASYYLPDAQWLISRISHGGEVYAFAAKGGSNGEPHNHNDLGHFILYGAGEVWCSDLGCGEYTAEYFGEGRYGYDCNGSQGHSVPIIDGHVQQEGPDSAAVVWEAVTGEAVDRLALELTSAYRVPALQSFTRTLEWNKQGNRPELTLSDRFTFGSPPESLVERIVTRIRPELVLIDGRQAVRLRAPGTYEQAEAGGPEVVQALEKKKEPIAAEEGTGEQPKVQDTKPDPAFSVDDRPGLLIHYDNDLVEPELTRHVFRDHFGKEAAWYAVDFKVKALGLHANIDFRFQFI